MIIDCVPIPGLTNSFKTITNGTSPDLAHYLPVEASLCLLNDVVAGTLNVLSDMDDGQDMPPCGEFLEHILSPFALRISHLMPHFDLEELIRAVVDQSHTFIQDPKECDRYEAGTSRPIGKMWLIMCALHPDADINHVVDPALGSFLRLMPLTIAADDQATYFEYLGVASCSKVDISHPLPALGIVFKQVILLHESDPLPDLHLDDAIYQVIRVCAQIGLNTVDAWQIGSLPEEVMCSSR
jgi:hypothetical protein